MRGHSEEIFSLAFSPDSSLLASGSWDNTTRLWDTKSAKCLQILSGHEKPVISVKFSPDGKKLFSSSLDDTILEWNIAGGRYGKRMPVEAKNWNSLDISPDGRYLLSSGRDTSLRLWNIQTGQVIKSFWASQRNPAIFCFDGKTILSSTFKTVSAIDIETGKILRKFEGYNHHIGAIALSPDGKTFAAG